MDWPSGTAVGRIMCNDDEWTVTLDYGKVMIIPPDPRDPRVRILNGPPAALPRGRDPYEVQGRNGPVHDDDLIEVEPGEVVEVEVYLRRSGVTGTVAHPSTLQVTTSVLEVFLSVVDEDLESDEEIYEDVAHESTVARSAFFVTASVGDTSVTVPGAVVSTTPREVATPREVEEVATRGPLHDHVIRLPGGSFVDEYHALHREIHVMRPPERGEEVYEDQSGEEVYEDQSRGSLTRAHAAAARYAFAAAAARHASHDHVMRVPGGVLSVMRHPETQSRGFLHGHVTRSRLRADWQNLEEVD